MDINATEVLKLSCSAVNGTSTSQTVTPSYETRYFSRYGKVVQGIGGDATPITFVKGEKKTFSLVLPKGVSPQFYNLKVGLDNTDVYSNNVFLNYIIGGVNATIQKLSLDKDYYQRGDKGEISLIWSASTVFKISLKANVTDEGGKACIDEVVEPLVRNLQNPITTIPFEVKSNCLNPKVSVVILDEAGNVLDQKDFAFKSTSENEEISKKVNSKSTIIIVLAVLVVVGVGIYMKRKRKNVISN
jgi:hypothetical protein